MRAGKAMVAFISLALLMASVAGCCCVYGTKYNVSGTVTDEHGSGMPGVTIGFGDKFGTAETDEDGQWNKVGLYGSVTVTPKKAGFRFEPETRVVDQNTDESVDFVGYPKPLDLEFSTVYVKEVREGASWIPGGDDPEYSYGILGVITNAGGPGELKVEIYGMPHGITDASWTHLETYGPRSIGPGSADIVVSIPSSDTRYGWLKLELYGSIDSVWVLSDDMTKETS